MVEDKEGRMLRLRTMPLPSTLEALPKDFRLFPPTQGGIWACDHQPLGLEDLCLHDPRIADKIRSLFLEKNHRIICIHGPAGVGKRTLAHLTLRSMGFDSFDSCMVERTVDQEIDELSPKLDCAPAAHPRGVVIEDIEGMTEPEKLHIYLDFLLGHSRLPPVIVCCENPYDPRTKTTLLKYIQREACVQMWPAPDWKITQYILRHLPPLFGAEKSARETAMCKAVLDYIFRMEYKRDWSRLWTAMQFGLRFHPSVTSHQDHQHQHHSTGGKKPILCIDDIPDRFPSNIFSLADRIASVDLADKAATEAVSSHAEQALYIQTAIIWRSFFERSDLTTEDFSRGLDTLLDVEYLSAWSEARDALSTAVPADILTRVMPRKKNEKPAIKYPSEQPLQQLYEADVRDAMKPSFSRVGQWVKGKSGATSDMALAQDGDVQDGYHFARSPLEALAVLQLQDMRAAVAQGVDISRVPWKGRFKHKK